MKVYFGSDHAGYKYKEMLLDYLANKGFEVKDLGTDSEESVDYPDYGQAVGEAVASDPGSYGVVICGTGIGIAMAAGKVSGIRAATVHDEFTAEMAKKHNNANVISLGARVVAEEMARQIVDKFFETEFEGGRHERRVEKINSIENGQ